MIPRRIMIGLSAAYFAFMAHVLIHKVEYDDKTVEVGSGAVISYAHYARKAFDWELKEVYVSETGKWIPPDACKKRFPACASDLEKLTE